MLVRHQPRLAVLGLPQQLRQRQLAAAARIRSGSVLMNSPTMCSTPASSAGRPATVTPNTTSSRPVNRPSRMPHAVCITVFSVTACSRAARLSAALSSGAERQHDLLRRDGTAAARAAAALRGAEPRALLKAGQRLPPGRKPCRAVLPGDEGEVIAVRRHPRQRRRAAAPRIGLEQLPHQDRRRPAVHQQVMVADQQTMPVRRRAGSAQTASAAAPPDRTAPARSASRMLAQPPLLLGLIEPRQIDQPPRHRGPRQHHLHRPAQMLMPEARPQARVPRRPRPASRPPAPRRRARPQAPAQAAPCRRPVPAHRRAHGTAAPPAAATAAGCPRSAGYATLQPLDLALRQIDQRQIARASGRPRRAAPHAAPAPSAPGTSVSARSRTAASSSSAGAQRPVRRQPPDRPPRPGQRIDLDRMRQRHRRIAAATRAPHRRCVRAALHRACRRPVGDRPRRPAKRPR